MPRSKVNVGTVLIFSSVHTILSLKELGLTCHFIMIINVKTVNLNALAAWTHFTVHDINKPC